MLLIVIDYHQLMILLLNINLIVVGGENVEMTRGWWKIIDPEQIKPYLDSLHPRGVREKELSRMLTRFLDVAKESCLKVIHCSQKKK